MLPKPSHKNIRRQTAQFKILRSEVSEISRPNYFIYQTDGEQKKSKENIISSY